MKRFITLCFLAVFGLSIASAADKVEGLWKSIDEKTGKTTAAWHIYQKDGVLYGEILTVPNQADSTIAKDCKSSYPNFPIQGNVNKMTVIHTPFIFGLKMKNAGQWEGGNIIDPNDGKMYKCKITFHDPDSKRFKTDTLEMRGELGLGIGRSQFWARTNEAEIATMKGK